MTFNIGFRQVVRNIAWHSSEKVLRVAFGFWVGIWLARYLGPEKFGDFNYITAWLGMFEAIAWMGVGENMMRDLVRDRSDEGFIMGSAFLIRICGSLLAITLALIMARPLGGVDEFQFTLLVILCINVPFKEACGGIWLWFASHTNIGPAVIGKNISIIFGALFRVLVIVTGSGLTALSATVTLESILLCICLTGAYLLFGQRFTYWRFDVSHAWRMMLNGLPIILSSIVFSLNARIAQVMLGRLMTMSDVGIYAAAMRFSEIWWVVPPMIIQTLASRYIYPKDLGEQLNINVARIVLGMALLSLIPCLFISAIGPEIIDILLGKQYLGASSILIIHIWLAVLIFIDAPVNQYLLATKRSNLLIVKASVAFFLNFVILLVLVPRFGAIGAAMATLIAEAIVVFVLPIFFTPLRDVMSIYYLAISQFQHWGYIIIKYILFKALALLKLCAGWVSYNSHRWRNMWWIFTTKYCHYVGNNIGYLAIVFGLGICAMFCGLLAATANPVMIGLGTCLILGPFLLAKPEISIWLIIIVGLVMGALSASPLGKITWGISVLSMLLFMISLINIFWSKQRQIPGFMMIALLFLVYAVGVSIIQWYSLLEFMAGFKRYFQLFGLMMALTMIAFIPEIYIRWRNFLLVVAFLQFPFALYQLFVLVPLQGGLAYSSGTTDVVAGTFGSNSILRGSSGSVMVIYLIIVLSFIVARWRSGLIQNKTFYVLALICLLPIGMGETKVVVIMLPIVGMVLLKEDLINSPLKYFSGVFILVLLTGLFGYIYLLMMGSSLDKAVLGTLAYNVGDVGYSDTQSLNRWSSITFWFQQQNWHDPIGFLIGNGLGSSFSEGGTMPGHVGLNYYHYGINLTATSTLLWDTGLIGLILFVSIFIAAWFSAGRLQRSVSSIEVKADALAIQVSISLFLLDLIYADSMVNLISMELIYALVLGYLGYLMNLHGLLGKQSFSKSTIKQYSDIQRA
jgi:O-antigen/teichoic acid export membrane protein